MSIFTYRTMTKEEVLGAVVLANAAYAAEPIPSGWRPLKPGELGLAGDMFDGVYFRGEWTLGFGDARALPLVSSDGTTLAVSFRGTDSPKDYPNFADVPFFNNYLNAFNPLLGAVADLVPFYDRVLFTGHSLGAAAVNQLRNIADTAFDGRFANAYFVGVATPLVSDNGNILNIGFENDYVYKVAHMSLIGDPAQRTDFANATSDLVWYDAGYDKPNLLFDPITDISAHGIGPGGPYQTAVERIIHSVFYDVGNRALPEMTRESVVVVDAFKGTVSDKATITSDHFGEPAFILGSPGPDVLIGGPASDGIEGGDGNDRIEGGGGRDYLFGGRGVNILLGAEGNDYLEGGDERDTLNGGPGNDALAGEGGNDLLVGDAGNDWFYPGTGNDKLIGGDGYDSVWCTGLYNDFNVMSVSVSKKGLVKATVEHAHPIEFDLGTDSLAGVEAIRFYDGVLDLVTRVFSPFGAAEALLVPADAPPAG